MLLSSQIKMYATAPLQSFLLLFGSPTAGFVRTMACVRYALQELVCHIVVAGLANFVAAALNCLSALPVFR